jgi:large subunit ribosomal protein L25
MEQVALKANLREGHGKQKVKKLRKGGLVPGIVYHRGEKSVSIELIEKDITKILRTAEGENILISLQIEGSKKKSRAVIIKEVQHHPVKRGILHVDFNEISLNEKILIEVEVVGQGEPIGVKQDGGVLDHPLRVVKVQCLPADIPKHIDVDLTGLKLNGSIHVRDLVVSEKVKVLTDPDALLFQVKLPMEEKVEETPAQAPEIEVIREKKDEPPASGGKAGEKKEEAKSPAGGGSLPDRQAGASGGKVEKK